MSPSEKATAPPEGTTGSARTGRITVGIDGSETSVRALAIASSLADARGTALDAVATWSMPSFPEPDYISPAYSYLPGPDAIARAKLTNAVAEVFGAEAPPWLTSSVLEANPAQELIRASKASALLVVGSRGHGGFIGALIGSVARSCAAHAHCPVLIVPPADRRPEGDGNRGNGSSERNRIVVGIDGSPPAVAALREARRLAEDTGAGITMVAAWHYGLSVSPYVIQHFPDASGAAHDLLKQTAERVFGANRPEGLRLRTGNGYAPEVLMRAAGDAEMLVVGSRGHGGFAGLLLGSVSAACISHATCPVLVTRAEN